uniref:Uncharacterized protein n=1 Tax=Utricularia reniformis TaxID=192314 RepID=A0A1Y0B262_9LAMI|nr:hypothetical protein AEK19_MT1286 [Utricularia reniformis]ART31490.1 hypothetical protein AEK19_MT1286 [Utricularia reniformis]
MFEALYIFDNLSFLFRDVLLYLMNYIHPTIFSFV